MAFVPPGRPEDQHESARRLHLVVPADDEQLPAGAGSWLVTHVAQDAARQAADEIANLDVPGLHRVVYPLEVALDRVSFYPAVVIVLWLGEEETTAAAHVEELRRIDQLRVRYDRANRGSLQQALAGEVQHAEAGLIQCVGRRADLNDSELLAALGQCYLHPVDLPEQDLVDLFGPYFGRLARPALAEARTHNAVAGGVVDAVAYLAEWGVGPEYARLLVDVFKTLMREVEADRSKPTIHRPPNRKGIQATALELLLTGYYDEMLSYYKNPQRRKAQQENIARMVRDTVIPRLKRDVPGLRRPANSRVTSLVRLHTAAKLVATL